MRKWRICVVKKKYIKVSKGYNIFTSVFFIAFFSNMYSMMYSTQDNLNRDSDHEKKRNLKNVVCEYIWIGGHGELRSKTKVLHNVDIDEMEPVPKWNFDGSSTDQAPSNGNTEVMIKPVAGFKNPLRTSTRTDKDLFFLVLCDTYDCDGKPLPTNHRFAANNIFLDIQDEECWFGLEQEYFIRFHNSVLFKCENNGSHYCGRSDSHEERELVEEHLRCCLEAGINISGINAEVATNQWEFQIGPSKGIKAADELIVARYLLEKIAEKYNASIDYSPKIASSANGSGCHINFSTAKMRADNGIEEILACMEKLKENHTQLITCYGEGNKKRLTGLHETSSYDDFTWGIGTRNTSVRVPTLTNNLRCGYFEDRRPAANIDPYLATSSLAKTCCKKM